LVAIRPVGSNARGNMQWLCHCDCGTEQTTEAHLLLRGTTRSCGCLHRQMMRETRTTHGDYNSPEYRTWYAMLQRCNNPNRHNYKNYGGRGISVCERWSDYATFLMDMGRKPSPKHSIERIDNDAGYLPSNCKWATPKEQKANQRPRHDSTIFGSK
jgi:hypothetical protein